MNINKLTLTFAALAAAMAVAIAIAPSLSPNAYAVKTVQEEECVGDPQDRPRCPGNSAEGNPHRVQEECEVTAGSNDHIVQGQQRKVCD